jgi:hypothetical protein
MEMFLGGALFALLILAPVLAIAATRRSMTVEPIGGLSARGRRLLQS